MTSDFTRCRSCDSVLREVPLTDGTTVLTDYGVGREAREGRVAFNPDTRMGRIITVDEVDRARGWVRRGALIYVPHDLTCVRPGGWQLRLGGHD